MSILKSTNSGSHKLLTLEYLYSRGWYHPKIGIYDTYSVGLGYPEDGIDRSKICIDNIGNCLSVGYENGKEYFYRLIKDTHDFNGELYDIEYEVVPKTIKDIVLIEKYFTEHDLLKKILLEREMLSSPFTNTTITKSTNLFNDYVTVNNFILSDKED